MQKSRWFSIVFTISICTPFVMHGCEVKLKEIPSLKEMCLKKLAKLSISDENMVTNALTTPQLPRELQAPLFAKTLNVNPNIFFNPTISTAVYTPLLDELSPEKKDAAHQAIHKITDRSTGIEAINNTKNIDTWVDQRTASRILAQAQILHIDNLESLFHQSDDKEKMIIIAACREQIAQHRNKHHKHLEFIRSNLEKLRKIYSPIKRKRSDDPMAQLLAESTGSPVKKAKRRLNI